jgi:hypothetical protein
LTTKLGKIIDCTKHPPPFIPPFVGRFAAAVAGFWQGDEYLPVPPLGRYDSMVLYRTIRWFG